MRLEEELEQVQSTLGRLLQIGVSLASAVVLGVGIVYLVRHGSETPQYRHFTSEPPQLRSLTGVLGDLKNESLRAALQFGLLLLIATPFARVLFSVYTFMKEKDKLYTGFTIVVLVLLTYSLFASK